MASPAPPPAAAAAAAAPGADGQRRLTPAEQRQADLQRRDAKPYLTARDVHRLVIVPATEVTMIRYVELPGVRGGAWRHGWGRASE